MGCGAGVNVKYEAVYGPGSVPKPPSHQSREGPSPPKSCTRGNHRSKARADQFSDGIDVQAMQAANDVNLLKRYAESGKKKRTSVVFAPPLEAPVRQGSPRRDVTSSDDEEYSTLDNNTVGSLKLKHRWVKGEAGA